MSSQWIIQRESDKFNVLWRQGLTREEARGILSEFGRLELELEKGRFQKCNVERTYPMNECMDYILAYAKAGDHLIINQVSCVIMEQAHD